MVFAALLLLAAGHACRDDSQQAPDESAPAAKVVELVGNVVAESAAGPRVLAVADEVAGADTLVTAAGSSVTVRFYHNDAQWTLGSGKRRRVSESAAWSAPRSQGEPALFGATDEDLTAAAGRHGEREAASTRTTALAPAAAPEPDDEAGGARSADLAMPEPVASAAPQDSVAEREVGSSRPARRKKVAATSSGSGGKSVDTSRSGSRMTMEMEELVAPEEVPEAVPDAVPGGATSDSKPAATRADGAKPASAAREVTIRLGRVTVTGPLDKAAITRAVERRLAALKECRDPSAATARATVRLAVSTSGAVTITGTRSRSSADQPWADCLARALAAMELGKAGELGTPAEPATITLVLERRAVP